MKTLIVDDHPLVLSGCRSLLESSEEMTMVEAGDAKSGFDVYMSEQPDVSVIDINLPGVSGYELARRILEQDAAANIIMFSMNEDATFAAEAIRAGAKGYFTKTHDPQEFLDAIRTVHRGDRYLPDDLIQKMAFLRVGSDGKSEITLREREILRLLAKGRSLAEIADLIHVSYKTVVVACASLRERLSANTMTELIRIAIEQKIV